MKFRAFTLIAAAITIAASAFDASALPRAGVPASMVTQSSASHLMEHVQYRRGVRAPGARYGGGYRGGYRRGGNGGAAAAAIIGLGVLGAIAAGSAASAAPAECWIERRRIVDDWGRVVGVRRVRVCR